MGVVYSMYDALVSINVPTEKAKAVIDAMEREMMDKVATKADLEHVRDILSRDIRSLESATKVDFVHLREALSRDIQATNVRIDNVTSQLTIRFIGIAAALASIAVALASAIAFADRIF